MYYLNMTIVRKKLTQLAQKMKAQYCDEKLSNIRAENHFPILALFFHYNFYLYCSLEFSTEINSSKHLSFGCSFPLTNDKIAKVAGNIAQTSAGPSA